MFRSMIISLTYPIFFLQLIHYQIYPNVDVDLEGFTGCVETPLLALYVPSASCTYVRERVCYAKYSILYILISLLQQRAGNGNDACTVPRIHTALLSPFHSKTTADFSDQNSSSAPRWRAKQRETQPTP